MNAAGSNKMGTESVDLIDAWQNLYVMLGTSSAALIGLLFIATSIHLGEVVSNPGFRVRSYNQTLYLLTLLVEAIFILVPQYASADRSSIQTRLLPSSRCRYRSFGQHPSLVGFGLVVHY